MTVVICRQLAPVMADLAANRELTCAAVGESIDAGAQLVILPELITSGYVFESMDEARSVAITPDHELFADWAALAAKGSAVVIGGFCETGPGGTVYNSAAVVDGSGVLAVYRKLHLWDTEKNFFTPGSAVPPVVETQHGRIGVIICYDLEFPELTRSVALRGADLLAVPTNWPLIYCPEGERAPEVQVGIAAARVNRMSIACCDRVGTERGQEWTGGTTIISESGWVVATADEAGIARADLDLTLARDKVLTPLAHVFGDRRPEFYGALTAKD
ncbi:putative amidohydrolase [Nakamurella sp. UYEF19]|uniref:nitrilase-related carbon-nitrogen hydrolase n=1 Tax=Nakamurella sp. UYEF19 TaxID=1756392 RepID=UPI0033952679